MTLLVAAIGAVLGAALQGATGFGFALVAAPLLVAVLGPAAAVSTMVVLATVVNLLTLGSERRRPRPELREAVVLTVWSLPGLVAGALVLRLVPERVIELLVALAVLLAVALRLRAPRGARPPSTPRAAAAGLASGLLSTSTGVGGPPIVFHLLARGLAPDVMRDTLAVAFLAGGALSAAVLVAVGAFALPAGMPVLLAATVAGQFAGRRAFATLHGARYERVVLVVLALAAVGALVASAT